MTWLWITLGCLGSFVLGGIVGAAWVYIYYRYYFMRTWN